MRGKAKVAYDCIEEMLQAVFDWQDKVDALVTTGDDDDEIIATHDSRGRLIELWVRPGMQEELTTAELEDRINDAIADNAGRAQTEMKKISDSFLIQFSSIPKQFAQHPVGAQLADAYKATMRPNRVEQGNWERAVR
ncbi:hypothetical protein [Mycobacterium sp. SP-6446]|uniref:hypothetical protein n=1 Tax=Mycobacterium sp. SP-6446 TaxID=1834162 RepID=UPI00096F2C58|nr:hypothetical protein [Mycobacterium sp. SP-6446]OMC13505.1 hypothetical protein A5736_22900 [Mycobacterium sp. SP-6446]